MPTLVVVGGKSPAWFHHGTQALAQALPNAGHRVLDGQTHMVKATALAPLLAEFFTSGDRAARRRAQLQLRGAEEQRGGERADDALVPAPVRALDQGARVNSPMVVMRRAVPSASALFDDPHPAAPPFTSTDQPVRRGARAE
jgi:hypothetical protein